MKEDVYLYLDVKEIELSNFKIYIYLVYDYTKYINTDKNTLDNFLSFQNLIFNFESKRFKHFKNLILISNKIKKNTRS